MSEPMIRAPIFTLWTEFLPPVRSSQLQEVPASKLWEIVVKSYVGGLVKSLERQAA